MNPHLHLSRSRRRSGGFSLVAAMLMMTLMLLLAFGLLSLSTVSLRASQRNQAEQLAKANARLALKLAIGQLQRLTGPDARITAPPRQGSAQPHLTGVWEGWKWDGQGSAPDWQEEKSERFLGWLSSSPQPQQSAAEGFAASFPPGETVPLVAGSQDEPQVLASLIPLDEQSGGALAWTAFDQSRKISASVPQSTGGHAHDTLLAAAEPGYAGASSADWRALADPSLDRAKLASLPQVALASPENDLQPASAFHDLAAGTLGVIADASRGGLSRDLSRLFERAALPDDYASRFIYSDSSTPLAPPAARFDGANPMPSPDPSWSLLHSHYRAYTRLAGGKPSILANLSSVTARPAAGTSPIETLHHKAFTQQQIVPVVAKAQFAFSLAFGHQPETLPQMYATGGARQSPPSERDVYITWLVIDPVITLWNPYNIPLRFTGGRVDLYRVPFSFRLYKNGRLINQIFTKLTDTHTRQDFLDRENRYYRLNLLPEEGSAELTLQPGEHIVLTAQNHRLHGSHGYNVTGLTLRPGFFPPAGAASDPRVGGVTTQNLFVDSNNNNSGRDYNNVPVRTVAVKPNDIIEIEVKPGRSNVNTTPETGGREITGFLKYYLGGPNVFRHIGGIEIEYGDREDELLPSFSRDELPSIVVPSNIPVGATPGFSNPATHALRYKEPFLLATFQLKTERDSRFPSRSWIHNAPANLYSSAGIDQKEDFAHHQYEFKWEPMTDWPPDSPTIEIAADTNRGYGGPGIYAQSGSEFATFATLPLGPAASLAQLRHAPLNAGGQLPLVTQILANSFAPPLLDVGAAIRRDGNKTLLDHSYLANNALFDSWFLSTAADRPATGDRPALTARPALAKLFAGEDRLPNRRFIARSLAQDPGEQAAALLDDPESHLHIASRLLIEGPFNVNSTRRAAWEAFLASNFGADAPLADGSLDRGEGLPVLRHHPSPAGVAGESSFADYERWNGLRRLDKRQISELAEHLVEEIEARGPFLSVAEFVNRHPGSGDSALSGALQSAIEKAGINNGIIDANHQIGASPGNTADGAPAIIDQADLLTPLAPLLTARGDTFLIRAYGEAPDGRGGKARAWCEAVVQRIPEYLDDSEQASTYPPSLSANLKFGRRFELASFRWLNPAEIRSHTPTS